MPARQPHRWPAMSPMSPQTPRPSRADATRDSPRKTAAPRANTPRAAPQAPRPTTTFREHRTEGGPSSAAQQAPRRGSAPENRSRIEGPPPTPSRASGSQATIPSPPQQRQPTRVDQKLGDRSASRNPPWITGPCQRASRAGSSKSPWHRVPGRNAGYNTNHT